MNTRNFNGADNRHREQALAVLDASAALVVVVVKLLIVLQQHVLEDILVMPATLVPLVGVPPVESGTRVLHGRDLELVTLGGQTAALALFLDFGHVGGVQNLLVPVQVISQLVQRLLDDVGDDPIPVPESRLSDPKQTITLKTIVHHKRIKTGQVLGAFGVVKACEA